MAGDRTDDVVVVAERAGVAGTLNRVHRAAAGQGLNGVFNEAVRTVMGAPNQVRAMGDFASQTMTLVQNGHLTERALLGAARTAAEQGAGRVPDARGEGSVPDSRGEGSVPRDFDFGGGA